jgi:peptidoglycan/xylan/chitin deacetylase (PgdA/CDA1 family)
MLDVNDILRSAGVRGVFFINTAAIVSENEEGIVKELAKNHEVGSHSHTHPDLTKLSIDEVFRELDLSKQILSKIVGREVKSLAYPYGAYNNTVVEAVKRSGYIVARTTDIEPPITKIEDFLKLPVLFHDFLYLNKEAVENLLRKLLKQHYTPTTLDEVWKQVVENPVKALNTILKLLENQEQEKDMLAIILLHPWRVRELKTWRDLEQTITISKTITLGELTKSSHKTKQEKKRSRGDNIKIV